MFNANELKGVMAKNDYTQEKLAEAIGVNTATIWRKLNGKVEFTLAEIRAISDLFHLTESERTNIFFA